jgi:methylated-DNA-[protein]-cysteine S-methyltransferase
VSTTSGVTVFDTAIGPCGIAWRNDGICGISLPEGDATATVDYLRRRFGHLEESEPPLAVRRAIDAMVALLDGEPVDLTNIELDLADVPEFACRVYAVAREIPSGQTLTYGEIATRLGDPTLARAVGQALGQNPFPIVVPCHRVLAAGGLSGGFSAPGGVRTKQRMLQIEGAPEPFAAPTLFDV